MSTIKKPVAIAIAILVVGGAALVGALSATALDDDPAETTVASPPATAAPAPAPTLPPAAADEDRALAIEPDDAPLSDAELARVREAALRIAGGGEVTDVDRSDDIGEAYEVEVVGSRGEIDVALDRNLERVPNLRYDD
jgi:hypothetical protein